MGIDRTSAWLKKPELPVGPLIGELDVDVLLLLTMLALVGDGSEVAAEVAVRIG